MARESFVPFWEFRILPGYPLPLDLVKSSTYEEMSRQNLLPQKVRGKILRTKELTHSGVVRPLLLSPWQ
jgi:hypothetical protein